MALCYLTTCLGSILTKLILTLIQSSIPQRNEMNRVVIYLVICAILLCRNPLSSSGAQATSDKLVKLHNFLWPRCDQEGVACQHLGSRAAQEEYPMPWHADSLSYGLDPVSGIHLISLDSDSNDTHFGDRGGVVSAQDMKWLENDLASNITGKVAILMTHHALNYRPGVQGRLNYVGNIDQVKGFDNTHIFGFMKVALGL
jgi:hypothetical protein